MINPNSKYPNYKPSDIEWIGEIPSHWEVRRFGHLFLFSRGLGITKQDLQNEGIPCVNYGEIHSKYGFEVVPERHPLKCVDESFLGSSSKSLLSRGDFIFADTSEDVEGSGNFTCLDSDTPTFAGYHTIIARHSIQNNYRFLAYFFDSLEFRNQIRSLVNGIKVFSITQAILKNSNILLPPPSEQQSIAIYLDRKTTQIDQLIADKKRLLELYDEEKTTIINQTVTKGMDPDITMKDSGIEWLGEIPGHWDVKRLKYVADINPPKNSLYKDSKETFVFLPMEKVSETGKIDCEIKKPIGELWNGFTYFEKNDVIIAKITPCFENGKGALLDKLITDIGFGSTEFHVLRASSQVLSNYLFYMTRSELFMKTGEAFMTGAAGHKRVPTNFISEFLFPIPTSIQEQHLIVRHIETECNRINAKIAKTQKLIELLTEYRTALISEVVTGKVKVIN